MENTYIILIKQIETRNWLLNDVYDLLNLFTNSMKYK